MAHRPWFKFYRADWLGDPLLRSCSLRARGVLIDLVCIMEEATPRGYLLINGEPPSDKTLTSICREPGKMSARCVLHAILELETIGVLSRDEQGRLYSRRIVRQAEKEHRFTEFGTKGGNPQLTSQRDNPKDNPRDKGRVSPICQKLETRDVQGRQWRFSTGLYVSAKLHGLIAASVGKYAERVNWDGLYNVAACDYAEHGEPADKIADLKARARRAVDAFKPSAGASIPSAEATARMIEASRADAPGPEEREQMRQMIRDGVLRRPLSARGIA